MSDDIHSHPLPDLSTLSPAMRAYIETLQAENRSLRAELEQALSLIPISEPTRPY